MDTDIFTGVPTHIEKAGGLLQISLQKDHKLGLFVENYLHENLKDLKNPRFIPKREDLVPGAIGIGLFDDRQYYRIKILEPLTVNNLVSVLFIDYGNVASLPLSDIRLLNYEVHKTLLNIPALSITCYLENVWVSKPWNDDELNTLKKLVLYEQKQCVVRQLHPRVKVVNIYFHNANKKLTELIVEYDLGSSISDNDLLDAVKRMKNNRLGSEERILSPGMSRPSFSHRLSNLGDYQQERMFPTRELSSLNFSSAHMLPVGSSHIAYVSHVADGPYSFSIQLKSSAEDALPRLTKLLSQHEPILNNRPLLPGTMVMTRHLSENSFRRAIVMDVKSNMCQVYHTDYGSAEEVPSSEIYELPSQAHHAPSMALRFCLADIKISVINDSCKGQFKDLLLGKQVLIRVVKPESEGPLLQYCEMFYEGRNVKDILHAFNAPLEYTLQQPPRGKDLKITVSHIEGPSLFYIQYNSKLDLINHIQDEINKYCRNQVPLKDLSSVGIGSPVSALFEDNVWYRAMIVSLTSDTDGAQVYYVDYGNRCVVPPHHMCSISRDLVTKWRTQAVECCLNGFENENINDADEVVIAKMEETLNQTYSMTPLKILSAGRLLVELIDEVGNKLSVIIKELKIKKPAPPSSISVAATQVNEPYTPVMPEPTFDSTANQKVGKDNMFTRPAVRQILEHQEKLKGQHSNERPSNKSYIEHDDRFDDSPKSYNRQSSFDKSQKFSKGHDNRQHDYVKAPSDEWIEPDSQDHSTNFGNKPSRESFGKGSWNTPNEGNKRSGGRFKSDDAGERPKFGNRPDSRGSKHSDSWNDDNKPKWGGDDGPRRDSGSGRFNERKSDESFGSGRFGKRDDNESRGRFGVKRHEDGERGGGRFGGDSRGDRFGGDNKGDRFGRDNRGDRFGSDNRGDRFGGDHRGDRFGDDSRGDRFGGDRRGDRFGGDNKGGRFGGDNKGDRSGNDRFGSNRRRDDGEDKGWRDDNTERKGGRFQDNNGGGRRDGGRFGKDTDFRKKTFESSTENNFTSGGFSSKTEEWDDDTTPAPAPEAPEPGSVLSSFPIQAVSPDSSMAVLISYFTHPHEIFVQKEGCEPELDNLRISIDNLTSELIVFKEDSLSPGVPLLARFSEDQALYRGIVKKLVPPSKAHILFVDFGNSEVVSYQELYHIPPEILNIPPLAYCCKLTDILPLCGKWPEEPGVYDAYITDEVLTLKVLTVKIVDCIMIINGSLTNSAGMTISQQLIDGGLALPGELADPDTEFEMVQPTYPIEPAPTAPGQPPALDMWVEHFALLKNQVMYCEILELVEDTTFVIRIIDAKVVTLAVLSDHQAGSCIKPSTKALAEINDVLDDRLKITLFGLDGEEMGPFNDDKREPRTKCPVCKFPVVRRTDRITVTHLEGSTVYIQRLADADRLTELLEETYRFYNESLPEEKQWEVGTLCAAKSLTDDNWYRAVIIQCDDKYTVKFLDYGNTEDLPSENLRTLNNQFYFSEMSLAVSLNVNWKKSPDSSLIDVIAGEEFNCALLQNSTGDWIVELNDNSGKRIIDMLVEQDLAEEKPENPFDEINSPIGSHLIRGDKIPILVSHADSPTMFCVQLQNHIDIVTVLQEKLQEAVVNAGAAEESDIVFSAKYAADEVWYRATKVSDDMLRFIDYGNTDVLADLKKLPDNLLKPYSGYAIPMYLCAKSLSDDWSDDAIKEFELFIEQECIAAEIVNVDYKIVADLWAGEKQLSKILVEGGHASHYDYTPEIIRKYVAKTNKDSFAERIFSMGDIYSVHEEAVINDQIKVFICHTNALNDFYVQEDAKAGDIDLIANSLFELENEEIVSDVKVGELYAVKFEDDSWYRALILSTEPEVEVLFIDFGNTSIGTEIRQLPKEVVGKAPLALHCSLGVEESEDALAKFRALSNDGLEAFNMRLLHPGSINVVELCDLTGTNILDLIGISSANTMPSDRKKVFFTHLYGPDLFYAQTAELLSMSEDLAVRLIDTENFEKLGEIAVGDMIAALYPEDGCWYRGQVLSSAPDIVVRFIDYGNTAVITEHRELPNELKEIKPLTIKCSLQLPEGCENWTEDCSELFTSISSNNPDGFEMELISETPVTIVELFLYGEPVTEKLVSRLQNSVSKGGSEALTNSKEVDLRGKGYITHINSVSEFYIQREDCVDVLSQVQSGLATLEENPNRKPDCGVGSLIASRFVDGEWYRGEILQIDPEIRVRFIDYGNECNVSEIAALTQELREIPPVAIKCSLELTDIDLKENAKRLFEKKLCGETLFEFSVNSVIGDLSIVEIILDGKNILDELCIRSEEESESSHDPLTECKNVSEPIKERKDSEGVSNDLSNKTIKGYISHINSVSDFFVQEQNSSKQLDIIQAALADESSYEAPSTLEINDVIGAKFNEDELWYRAEIIHTSPELRVRFIDYGNESVVSETRKLTNDLLDLPAVALRCSLQTEISNLNLDEEFTNLCGNSNVLFDFKFISCLNSLNIVEIWLDGENISLKLSKFNESDNFDKPITSSVTDSEYMQDESKEVTARNELDSENQEQFANDTLRPGSENVQEAVFDAGKENGDEITPDVTEPETNKESFPEPDECKLPGTEESSAENVKTDENSVGGPELVSESNSLISPSKNKLITHVNSISDFYIVNLGTSELTHIKECLLGAEQFEDPLDVSIEDILAGRTEEGVWHRCRVDEISGTTFKVFLIDLGYPAYVNNLKELSPELILVNPTALHCSLFVPEGIKSWSNEASEKFFGLVESVNYFEIIDDSVSPCVVKLRNENGDLSDQLAKCCAKNNEDFLPEEIEEKSAEAEKSEENSTKEKKIKFKSAEEEKSEEKYAEGEKGGEKSTEEIVSEKKPAVEDKGEQKPAIEDKSEEKPAVEDKIEEKSSEVGLTDPKAALDLPKQPTVETKLNPKKAGTPTKLKTVAEIKANAKSKINSHPASSLKRKVEKLEKPLKVSTNLDDRPIISSNPSSPNLSGDRKSYSPSRSVPDEKIIPGPISSGLAMNPSSE